MQKYTVRDIQLAQLELAKEFKRVCEEHNIKYFMDSGTLLGAVRHKGFIPWDDDMDFAMLRNDYEELLRIAPHAFGRGFFLQTWDNDPYYPYAFAKLRKLGTTFVESAMQHNPAHNELFIDIFPYDSFPKKKLDQIKQGSKIERYRLGYMMKLNVKPWLNHTNMLARVLVYIKYLPAQIYAFFHEKERLHSLYKEEMIRFNDIETFKVYQQSGGSPYGELVIKRSYFSELCPMKFEDTEFPAPKSYDEYLKSVYGDYLKLPPIKDRENKHRIIEIHL